MVSLNNLSGVASALVILVLIASMVFDTQSGDSLHNLTKHTILLLVPFELQLLIIILLITVPLAYNPFLEPLIFFFNRQIYKALHSKKDYVEGEI